MAQPELNFTGRDFTAEMERLLTLLRELLPNYTDFNESDAGMRLLWLLTRETDQLNALLDRAAEEGSIDWAQFRQSLIDIGLCVGYLPTLAAAASTQLQFTRTDASGNQAIVVPTFSSFARADGLTYLTVADVTLGPNVRTAAVNAIQGRIATTDVEPEDWLYPDPSGKPRFLLPKGVAGGWTEVWQGDVPISWTNVDSFWRSEATDLHYILELNGDTEQVWLVLGDGAHGALAPTETLHIRYVLTDEALGNCGHSMIYLVPDALSGLITCTNSEPATGGGPAEDADSIRRMIPAMVETQRRGLSKPDYEALLEHLPGVRHVQALDRDDGPSWPHFHVVLYVVPDGGDPMSSLLKDQIWAQCAEWGHLGGWKERYILKDAIEVPVDFTASIGVSVGWDPALVSATVSHVAELYFSPDSLGIGDGFDFGTLSAACLRVAGLAWIRIEAPAASQPGTPGSIFTLGTTTITIGG